MVGCYSGIDIFNVTTATDKTDCASIHMLWQVFGSPIDALSTGSEQVASSNIITLMIGHLDWVMLICPLIIYVYITWHGVIGSANEGRFGGRDLAHWSMPVRVILPPVLLFPIKGGFCLLQMLVMYMVMVGVNLANYVWHSTTQDVFKGFVPTTPDVVENIIESKIGLFFVYGAIAEIINSNDLAGLPVDSAKKISVWGSGALANNAVAGLKDQCSTFASNLKSLPTWLNGQSLAQAQKVIQTVCEDNINTMSGGSGSNQTYANYHSDLAPTSASKNGPFDVWASVGSAPGTWDGLIMDSGEISVATADSLNSFLGAQSGNALMKEFMTGFKPVLSSGGFAAEPTQISCSDYATCSFAQAADAAEQYLIKTEATYTPTPTQSVPGTGQTCNYVCRFNTAELSKTQYHDMGIVKYEPVPNVSTKDNCSQSYMTWTNQCYSKKLVYNTSEKTDVPTLVYTEIPAQPRGHQWWLASTMYLALTQSMSDNIDKLIQQVQTYQPTGQTLLVFTADGATTDPTLYYQFGIRQPSLYIKQGVAYSVIPQTDVTQFDFATGTKTGIPPYYVVATDADSINLAKSAPAPTGSADPAGSANSSLDKIAWSDLIKCYQPRLPSTTTPEACFQEAINKSGSLGPITIKSEQDSTDLTENPTGYPEWLYMTLAKMPVIYQRPMKVLIILNKLEDANGKPYISDTQFELYLLNITEVLGKNNAYPTNALPASQGNVTTTSEVAPATYWLNKIFTHVLGSKTEAGQQTSIIQQIYSLGNQDLTGGSGSNPLQNLMNNSFNTIATAQLIGLSMITTVTNSLEKTYQNFSSQFQSDASEDRTTAYEVGGAALGLALGGDIGGTMGSTTATIGSLYLQMKMAGQMFSIGKEMMWMPIVMMVLTSLFVAGISFAVVLPLLPFFIFWAGQIAWVLAVIEAVIAAPLVVIGVMTPGGHQHFGHAIPGIKMLFGVIFRPVLMIMGLMIGMVLTFAIIRFSSQGFQLVATQILDFASSGGQSYTTGASGEPNLTQGIVAVLLLFTFCSFMMLAFNKCFSIIYLLPEKVLTWIGGMADKAGAQEAQQMSQGMSQTSQSAGQAGGQSTTQGVQASQQNAQAQNQISGSMPKSGAETGMSVSKGAKSANEKRRGSTGQQKGPQADSGSKDE